jgi:hypothetical protein
MQNKPQKIKDLPKQVITEAEAQQALQDIQKAKIEAGVPIMEKAIKDLAEKGLVIFVKNQIGKNNEIVNILTLKVKN